MARKKITTSTPEDQEHLQSAEGVDSPVSSPDEQVAETGGNYPTGETTDLMEAEYQASLDAAAASEDSDTGSGAAELTDSGAEPPSEDIAPVDSNSEDSSDQEDPQADAAAQEEASSPIGVSDGTEEPFGGDDYESLLHDFSSTEPSNGSNMLSAEPDGAEAGDDDSGYTTDDRLLLSEDGEDTPELSNHEESGGAEPPPAAVEPSQPRGTASSRRRERVLTIDAKDEIQTEEDREAIIWHDIQNSHRTRRILTGTLDGVEKTESGLTLAVVNYKGIRVAIPIKEMLLYTGGKTPSGREYMELMENLQRILNSRLGCEIDFIVKGYDNDTRSVVASRKEAMYRKRQTFYLDTDEMGEHMIYEGRVVQARVVAVAEKVIRVEVFGVETSIVARDLSWEWIGNARDHFNVGDRILVRVSRINRSDLEHLSIRVDVRSVSATNNRDNLKKCMPQCRYAGRVTDVRNGVVFIRLNNGVNAIAHSCYDSRYPGKKDDVSFAVTRLDEEQGVALGIITRIIKQNL